MSQNERGAAMHSGSAEDTVPLIVRKKSIEFARSLFGNPFFASLALTFTTGKIVVNRVCGASWVTALRSGLVGMFAYVFGCYLIHMLSESSNADTSGTDNYGTVQSLKIFAAVMAWLAVTWVILAVTVLNREGRVDFKIPLWSQLLENWRSFVQNLADNSTLIEGTGLFGWPYLVLYLLIPAVFLRKSNLAFPRFFGMKTSKPALPFVAVYGAGFVAVRGIHVKSLLTLLFVIVWPALGEEFLYRGIVQRVLSGCTKNPVTGIVFASFLFALSHIPAYVLGSSLPPILAWSSLLPVLFTSFFWGYGYYRTGVLWPWILIHAVSNLNGL
jgi:membrane protease YdiL (CAAX protease family)